MIKYPKQTLFDLTKPFNGDWNHIFGYVEEFLKVLNCSYKFGGSNNTKILLIDTETKIMY